ncbi:MAG: hypothetical protein COT84_07485 [Chlamydiae bacterium CG10_big_fil_rev_8_21_14_0_10_35_9]|nr:MAG: hypothetical protein COT84_07485 [Chlamydiae bacterium CG10_big_fil_rev_8_21_14_0_10_35_9]
MTNIQYFHAQVNSESIIRSVTASSNIWRSTISFKVPSNYKEVVRVALQEIGTLVNYDTEHSGTWFQVIEIVNIKKSLDVLLARNLIAYQLYQRIVRQFPLAIGGNINLSSEIVDPASILQDSPGRISPVERVDDSVSVPFQAQELIREQEAINGTQKNIIEAILKDIFDSFQSITPAVIALEAIKLINKSELNGEEQAFLQKYDLIEEIGFLRKILHHPCPQNRAVGDPTTGVGEEGIRDGRVYFWNNGFGTGAISEPQGLLGLTARNDATASPITKEATVQYINSLIDKEKIKLEERSRIEKTAFTALLLQVQQLAERAFLNSPSEELN